MSADTAKSLKELEAQLAELEAQKTKTEKKLADLQKQKKDVEFGLLHSAAEAIKSVLNIKLINVLAPTHGGRTCTDEKQEGAYMDHGVARCTRCWLLSELQKNYVGDPFKLEVSVIGIRDEKEY